LYAQIAFIGLGPPPPKKRSEYAAGETEGSASNVNFSLIRDENDLMVNGSQKLSDAMSAAP